MIHRNDLLDAESPQGIDVWQLTHHERLTGVHVYMESPVFTPDCRHMVLELDGQAHYYYPHHDKHQYALCDLENGALTPLAGGPYDTAPAVSPDGKWLWLLNDQVRMGTGRLALCRVNLATRAREEVLVIDRPLHDTPVVPWRMYGLSSLSSDGARLAGGCFLGDGNDPQADWGLIVFNLERPSAEVIYRSRTIMNPHPQYCRSIDPVLKHDILLQDNHGYEYLPDGTQTWGRSGDMAGADVHAIRDDGSNLRDMPWGRDGAEYCSGHQCWRGQTPSAIASVYRQFPDLPENERHQIRLIEGRPATSGNHEGLRAAGARRNDLSRAFRIPCFDHFATDRTGNRLISDYAFVDRGPAVYLAQLGAELDAPATWRYLLRANSDIATQKGLAHIHPTLSPDGTRGFFNSTESGKLEAYMMTGLGSVFGETDPTARKEPIS